MGRELVTLEATASVSKHNSPQDDIDAKAWNAFVQKVKDMADAEPDLYIDVMGYELNVVGWKE